MLINIAHIVSTKSKLVLFTGLSVANKEEKV